MRLVTQQYDAALRPAGLRATQFTILSVLIGNGQMRQTELAEALGMEGTTLTRNLRPLKTRGWITIERDTDQRVRLVSVTDPGRGVQAEALPLWEQVQSRFVGKLGEGAWQTLLVGLAATAAIASQ